MTEGCFKCKPPDKITAMRLVHRKRLHDERIKMMEGKSVYTYLDDEDMPWRFEGDKPFSMLADDVLSGAFWGKRKP